jgi:ATP adenylyltransferase
VKKNKAKKSKSQKASQMAKSKAVMKSPKGRESNGLHVRDVLFRPERLKYIKSQRDSVPGQKTCVFCDALKQGISVESLVLWKGPTTMVVVNKFPYNPGHLLILPVRHEGDLLQFSQEELSDIMRETQNSVRILKKVFEPSDMNIGINLGRGAGAGIPEHLHVHIVPRWPGDTNFFPILAQTKVIPADLKTVYELLRSEFKKMENT